MTSSTEDRRSQGAAIVLAIALAFVAAYALALHAENTHLREQLLAATTGGTPLTAPAAQGGSPSVPSPTPATPAPVGPGRELTGSQRAAFVERIRTAENGRVWIATTPADPEAAAYRASLVQAIKDAGWQVLSDDTLGFRVKPGVFIFLAEDSSPPYLSTLNDALSALGEKVTLGRGYRAFYDDMKKKNPNYAGFDFKKDQDNLLVIGPRPRLDEVGGMSPVPAAP